MLVVGSGGREHALVEALAASPLEPQMYAAPGNVGISRIAETVDIPVDDLVSLRDYAADNEIDLTVVGPESPLIGGISEAFWEAGLKIFGPSRAAARIEGSKVFAKELMRHAGVPTARFEAFDREEAALTYLSAHHDYPIVVKADGAAAGKGVTVARSLDEAEEAVRDAFAGKFGAAGGEARHRGVPRREGGLGLRRHGWAGHPAFPAGPGLQAGLRRRRGAEHGGMGSYSPIMWMEPTTYAAILEDIIRPTIHQLALIGAPYTGLLYAGVMVTETGPKALEFNCRFGDPETQVILPRLGSDLLELMLAAGNEDLAGREVVWSADKAVCVVLASEGYPRVIFVGDEISGLRTYPPGSTSTTRPPRNATAASIQPVAGSSTS